MPILRIVAPTTGTVWQVLKAVGDPVASEEAIVLIESMKMEIPVTSPQSGRVLAIRTHKDAIVNQGELMVLVETTT